MPTSGDYQAPCLSGWLKYTTAGGSTCVQNIPCPSGMTKIGANECIPNKLLPATTTTLPAQTGNAGGGGTTTKTGTGTGTSTTSTTTTPTTQTSKTGSGGTTNTSNPTPATTSPATPPPKSTSTASSTAVTNVINHNKNVVKGSSGGGTSAATAAPHTPTTTNNNFLTYVNAVNKITIRYLYTWTKTEFTGNPSIPVIFDTPTTITTATVNAGPAAAAKNSFVVSITPSASNLDNFTQQRINALSHSNGVKYTITNTTAKVLTPPTGITAYREVSYDATKNIIVNNTIPTQVPLKGAAIFFVNSGTGYSLLYLAKQTEYTQNLPMIQQMVNSFQIGNGG